MDPSLITKALGILQSVPNTVQNAISQLGASPQPQFQPKVVGNPQDMQLSYGPSVNQTPNNNPPAQVQPLSSQSQANFSPSKVLDQVLPITRQAGIPDALTGGQFGIESYHGQDAGAIANKNYFGIKVNGKLVNYPSIEENARDYALTVKNILAGKGYDLSKMSDDPEGIVKALQEGKTRYEGSSDNPMQYVDLVKSMPEYMSYLKKK